MDHESAVAYATIVAQVLLADGRITVSEGEFLRQTGTRLGMKSVEIRRLYLQVVDWDVVDRALMLVPPEWHASLLRDLEDAAISDGEVAPSERELIGHVRELLSLD